MKNKKLMSLVAAGILGVSLSTITASASEKTANNTEVPTKLIQKAEKLQVDITNLTREEVKAKLKSEIDNKLSTRAQELKIDISNLSKEEIKAKIQELKNSKTK